SSKSTEDVNRCFEAWRRSNMSLSVAKGTDGGLDIIHTQIDFRENGLNLVQVVDRDCLDLLSECSLLSNYSIDLTGGGAGFISTNVSLASPLRHCLRVPGGIERANPDIARTYQLIVTK